MRGRLRGSAAALALAGVLAAAAVRAEPPPVFSPAAEGAGFEESFHRVLVEGGAVARPLPASAAEMLAGVPADDPDPTEVSEKKPHMVWITALAGATLVGSAWNSFGDGPNEKWHFTREGWLGQNTYAGGGDKASHVVSYYIVAKLLAGVNMELGMKKDQAVLWGAGTSWLAALVTEMGDARGKYGFSYEDLVMDSIGVASAIGIAHYGLDDLVGLRAGLVPEPAAVCCPFGGTGKDYTQEIYTADLKFAGLGQRMHFDPSIARYFMFSVSYSAKGYPYADPLIRDRQVGFELGINFNEILRALHVPPDKWWSKILYFAFDVLRIPYTQVGMYYGLNTGKWYGPGIGDQWLGK